MDAFPTSVPAVLSTLAGANVHDWIGPAVTAAAIGSFLGYRLSRKLELDRRREKTVDFTKAILAEIKSTINRHADINIDEHLEQILRKLIPPGLPDGASSNYTPFVPKRVTTIVFDALIAEIYVLPTSVVNDVVAYYEDEHMLTQLIEDMRDQQFSSRSQAVKAAIYTDFISLIKGANTKGKQAQVSIELALGKPAPRNKLIARLWPNHGRYS